MTHEGHRALLEDKLRQAEKHIVSLWAELPMDVCFRLVAEGLGIDPVIGPLREAAALLTAPLETVQPHLRRKADEWDARAKVLRAQTRLDDAELVESLAHELREAALTAPGGVPPWGTWLDISTAPQDGTAILRPHRIWGAMDVRYITDADADRVSVLAAGIPWRWLNGDYTTAWTDEAFLPFWMSLPAPPGTPSPEARVCAKHGPLVGVRYCPECAIEDEQDKEKRRESSPR